MGDIKNFLSEKEHLDGKLISSGEFTVSKNNQIAKLGQNRLIHESEWILLMVQAAVAGEARLLRVQQTYPETILTFELPVTPSLEVFQLVLSKADIELHSFLGLATTGLRTVQPKHNIELFLGRGSLRWNGKEWSRVDNQDSASEAKNLKIVIEDRGLIARWKRRKEFVETEQLLWERACYAPLVIELDGRQVDPVNRTTRSAHKRVAHWIDSPRKLCLANFTMALANEKVVLGEGPELPKDVRFQDPLRDDRPFLTWHRTRVDQPRGVLELSLSYTKSGENDRIKPLPETFQVGWLQHGVMVAEERIEKVPLGGSLILAGETLKTDLSGLAADITSQMRGQALRAFLQVAPDVFLELEQHLCAHKPRWHASDLEMMFLRPSVGALVGLGLGFFVGAPMKVAAVGAVLASSRSRRERGTLSQLPDLLEQGRQEIISALMQYELRMDKKP